VLVFKHPRHKIASESVVMLTSALVVVASLLASFANAVPTEAHAVPDNKNGPVNAQIHPHREWVTGLSRLKNETLAGRAIFPSGGIRGVNLGAWFVYEPYMGESPVAFSGITAVLIVI